MRHSIALLVLCLACADAPAVGGSTAAIAGGTDSDNDAIVFVVAMFGGAGVSCSGAVIGPRHVLLAKSCLYNDTLLASPSEVVVLRGPTARAPTGTFQGERIVAEPGSFMPPMPNANDLAIVITTEDIGVPALPIASESPIVDDTLTIIGYGSNGTGGTGTRREATVRVAGLMGTLVISEGGSTGACQSDGPALNAEGALVATVLYTLGGSACPPEGGNGFRDVTPYRDFIDDALSATPDDAGTGELDGGIASDAAMAGDAGGDAAPAADAGNDAGPEASGGGCAVNGSEALGVHACLLLMVGIWRRRRAQRSPS